MKHTHAKIAAKNRGLLTFATKNVILAMICVMAFSIRLLALITSCGSGPILHATWTFDPWFNYRVTKFLTEKGYYEMWNWFDSNTWYPLGRAVGVSLYPALMFTAGTIWKVLHFFNINIHIQEVCVFMGPLFSAFCCLACYGLVKEARSEGAGLMAAALVAMVPSYISRSVAGSYDNESIAIFALVNVFYWFLRTVNKGTLTSAIGLVFAYLYMVSSWGGYSFVINLLPIFTLACIVSGRLSSRLYVAFSPLVVIGTLVAASFPVVGFNAVLMSEHFGAFFAFVVLHVAMVIKWVHSVLPPKQFKSFVVGLLTCAVVAGGVGLAMVADYVRKSPTYGWTGRSLSLLDPTYAPKYHPLTASVSEHQPPKWSSYLMDLHILTLFVPAGIISCYTRRSDGTLFLILYGVTAVYFSSVMVRLMLVLAPAACCLAAVAMSDMMDTCCASIKSTIADLRKKLGKSESHDVSHDVIPEEDTDSATEPSDTTISTPGKTKAKSDASAKASATDTKAGKAAAPVKRSSGPGRPMAAPAALGVLGVLGVLLSLYVFHCIYASSDMYSSPSVVIQSRRQDGGVYVFDDFREAYGWLSHNTHPDTKVASWWDYGYQTTGLANRTVIIDNNTWNNTHMATVGRAMASSEAKAWKIFRSLDVEYVFVVFGAYIGYPSDDIAKFLWMVRIGGSVYPDIKEKDYLVGGQDYKIDATGTKTMLNTLIYKLSYYDFAEASQRITGQRGFDRVRNTVIGKLNVKLTYFEEVFTSQHWMMRIYRVRDKPLRDPLKKSGKSSSKKA